MLKSDLVEEMLGDIPQLNLQLIRLCKPWAVQFGALQTEPLFFFWTREILTECTLNATLLMSG